MGWRIRYEYPFFTKGKEVIPFLLRDIKKDWIHSHLLNEITGEAPWEEEDAGYFDKITDAWLAWAAKNQIIVEPSS